jgi:cytoskeletal protein RodZ
MASFGENLRREREMRGITLEEIAANTKISLHFLGAIEADELGKLPGGIYTRNFIRAFARYLGLDEEKVMSEYSAFAQADREVDLSRMTSAKPLPQESRASAWIGLLAAAALLAGGYALFRYSHRTPVMLSNAAKASPNAAGGQQVSPPPIQATAPPGPGSATTTGSAGNAALADQTTSPAPMAGPEVQKVPESQPPGATGPAPGGAAFADAGNDLVLQVAATERTWVDIVADGKDVCQRVLKPDEIQTFKAKDSFDLQIGNAEGIILTLNNETLGPLGGRGETRKIHLTRDTLKHPSP